MKKRLLLLSFFTASVLAASAQDTTKSDPPLIISGSVDTYYKYDFSKHSNIPTSFASDQNSISIGMIDLGLKKKVGKAAFVGELSFGPRGQYQSVPNGDGAALNANNSFHIQNLYVSYDVTDKFNLTGGYMATFMGYEVISPVGNFNYSTSYLFTNGPFQNPGFKATYAFASTVSLMAGIFNDTWNAYNSAGKMNTFGAQLMVSPVKGWTAYLNVLSGEVSGTEFDLTTSYQITDAFKLGLNAADFKPAAVVGTGGFTGVALYPQIAVSKDVTLGLRGEYFKTKNGTYLTAGPAPGSSVVAGTLTANIKAGPLTLIPEFRFDNTKDVNDGFTTSSGLATKKASQILVAAVYAF
ncbi:porin [Mucilaginibacter sp. RB4R14]|uniref:porin n=1 Tax=Mucilaginibacter aurantiaciroseus TaxID=2949308 RepID=UPI002090C37E|nr:porin [Mucilaginibacter aurantiaciroseus]MCO5935212.1 porin [Mucilaginibacter aurantiaciroseus]